MNGRFIRPPGGWGEGEADELGRIADALARKTARKSPDPSKAVARLVSLIDTDPRGTLRIAREHGLDPRQLQRLRNGEREDMLLGSAAAILAALGRSWADLDE